MQKLIHTDARASGRAGAVPTMTSADSDPDDLDAARGFDSDELATCVRVLTLLGRGASASGGGVGYADEG